MTDRAEQRISTSYPSSGLTPTPHPERTTLARPQPPQPARMVHLREGTDLLIRAERHLQFGTVPDLSHVLSIPPEVMVDQIHQVMRELRRPMAEATVIRLLGHCGIPDVHARGIVAELLDAGFLRLRPASHTTRVHVLGPALYARAMVRQLRRLDIPASGITPGTSAFARLSGTEVVILAGMLFPPPDLSYRLMELGAPHLTCGIVDSRVAVGPVVLPGRTGCLTCLDAAYLLSDAEWRRVRAQVAALPAPAVDRSVELVSSVTAPIVRELLSHRECGPDASAWTIPHPLRERRYFDPLSLTVTSTAVPRKPGCLSCAVAPATGTR